MAFDLAAASGVLASDLRKSERSIEQATYDIAQLIMTTIDTRRGAQLDVSMGSAITGPAIEALAAVANGQRHLTARAHPRSLRIAQELGIPETALGGGDPKPSDKVFTPVIPAASSVEVEIV